MDKFGFVIVQDIAMGIIRNLSEVFKSKWLTERVFGDPTIINLRGTLWDLFTTIPELFGRSMYGRGLPKDGVRREFLVNYGEFDSAKNELVSYINTQIEPLNEDMVYKSIIACDGVKEYVRKYGDDLGNAPCVGRMPRHLLITIAETLEDPNELTHVASYSVPYIDPTEILKLKRLEGPATA